MPTTLRNVRVPESLWASALALARSRGETISDVLREALEEYVRKHGSKST